MIEIQQIPLPTQDENANNPYDICLECPHRGKTCDGPNFFAMTHQRRVEWCNALKKIRGLTNAQIAERAVLPDGTHLSKATVDSVLSGRTQDVKTSTWSAILRVLIGGCWGQYPCHLAAMLLEGEKAKGDGAMVEELKKENSFLTTRISFLDGQIASKDSLINSLEDQIADWTKIAKRKNKWIVFLAVSLVIILAAIIAILIYDKMHPDRGWITDMAAIIAGKGLSFPYAAS